MIIGCMAVFNEARFVISALESIIGFVDRVVIVDGQWNGVKQPSTDGTVDVVKAYTETHPVTFIEAKAWKNEMEQREPCLIGGEGDVYFVLDADEVLFCGAEWLRRIERGCMKDERCFNVVIWNKGFPNLMHQRIYRHPFSYISDFPMAKFTVPIVIEHLKYKKSDLTERPVYATA